LIRRLVRNPLRTWREITPFLGASTSRVSLIVLASLGRAVTEAVILVLLARLAIALSEDEETISVSLAGLEVDFSPARGAWACLALGIVMLLLSIALARLTASMAVVGVGTARKRIISAFLNASWDLQARERVGHLQDLLTSYVTRVANAMSVISLGLTAILSLAALVVTALAANALAASAMLVSIGVVMVLMWPLSRLSRHRSYLLGRSSARFATMVTESVSVASETRVFGVERPMGARLDDAIDDAAGSLFSVLFLRKLVPAIYQSAAIILVVAGLGAVILLEPDNLAGLAVVVLLFIRASSYGQQLQTVIQQCNEVLPHLQELRAQERSYRQARLPDTGATIDRLCDLELRSVDYSYGDDSAPALVDLTCHIGQGEMVGVVGPSGSGKSTFVQILLRMREPAAGELLVNGRPADEVALSSWYQRVAIVPQRAQLIEGTVADNIAFLRDVSRDDVRRAAQQAHVHDEIEAMPLGYDTVIAGSGSLSGGQAQRLCLARAFIGTPDLIVLDEPTSALDVRSEAAVQEVLGQMKGTMTMVIIAHRLSTLRLCDRIMVLEGGHLQAFDHPEQLLESEGFYREAFELSQL
jgi:ABC-type multidrug transport system fused ATPase/permease subunit